MFCIFMHMRMTSDYLHQMLYCVRCYSTILYLWLKYMAIHIVFLQNQLVLLVTLLVWLSFIFKDPKIVISVCALSIPHCEHNLAHTKWYVCLSDIWQILTVLVIICISATRILYKPWLYRVGFEGRYCTLACV